MNKFTKILTAGTFAFASIAASASDITVGGVTWDPDYQTISAKDFIGRADFTQWFSTSGVSASGAPDINAVLPGTVGSMLQGAGEIGRFNGSTDFVCATCELTFTFGGLVFDGDMSNDGSLFNLAASKTSGYFNIYFDNTADFDPGNINSQADIDASADGSLFLSFGFESLKEGQGFTPDSGSLASSWNVTGGTAAGNFDSNSEFMGSDLGFVAFVDFQGNQYGTGSGTASGNSIPEPTTLAIFGLGLLGLAGAARRKA
ncbi:PEP-CTERM sorting domain-containing protein [Colwellia ponticola]|nr:PEP-CTERM sorting domain-containing protein [Colwellia ponticola]